MRKEDFNCFFETIQILITHVKGIIQLYSPEGLLMENTFDNSR